MQKKLKIILFGTSILLILLLIMEGGARIMGHTPGVYLNILTPVEKVETLNAFVSDSLGIVSYARDSDVFPTKKINNKGFPSEYDFVEEEKKPGVKRVMIIGDSYVDGCCADPNDASFARRLERHADLKVFNFGVGGTDPVQYRLILENYIDLVDPDLVIVAIYLGNDLLPYERKPRPGIPHIFPIKDCGWLTSELFDGEQVIQFETPQEAYDWYLNKITLWGPDRSLLQKVISKSALLSFLYIRRHNKDVIQSYDPKMTKSDFSSNEISRIDKICMDKNTASLIVGIPSPMDAMNQVSLKEEYSYAFGDVPWEYPNISDFEIGDYDGKRSDNHFNNSGHEKFYQFLTDLLKDRISYEGT